MSTSPTLSLKVTADQAGIVELTKLLETLKATTVGLGVSVKEGAGEAAARLRAEELEVKKYHNSVELLELKHQTKLAKLQEEAENTRSAYTRKVMLRSAEMTAKHNEGLLAQSSAANAKRLKEEADAANAAELYNRKVMLRSAEMTAKHNDKLLADQATANAKKAKLEAEAALVHEAALIKMAEKDVAYGQMELSRQIKLRKEIQASLASATLGPKYVAATYAPTAIADPRSIIQMEAALAAMKLQASGAATSMRELNGMMREGHSLARGLLGPLNAMWLTWGSLAPLLAGAGISSAIVGSIKAGSEFEVVLSRIQGVSGETQERVEAAGQAFKNLAEKSVFAAKDVATGAQILVQAGFSLGESIKTLPTVMQLASVGELNMANAAEIAAGTMHAFGLSINEIPGIANILSKAADISQTNIGEMGEAMKQASTVAQQYKVNLVDMSAGIASLAQVNIRGSAAGTAYRNMLNNMIAPTEKGSKELKLLGVSAFDATGQIKNMPEVFLALSESLNKLGTDSEKATAIANIFTERGAKGAVNYMRALNDGTIEQFTSKLKDVATTTEYLQNKQDLLNNTVGKQATMAFNALGVAMIEAFDDSSTGLLDLTKQVKEFVQSAEFKEGMKSLISGFVTLAKAVVDVIPFVEAVVASLMVLKALEIGAALIAWAAPLAGTAAGMLAVSGGVGVLSTALVALEAVVWPIGIAVAAVAAVWWTFKDNASSALDAVDARIGKSISLMQKLAGESYKTTKVDVESSNLAVRNANEELRLARAAKAAHEKESASYSDVWVDGSGKTKVQKLEADKVRIIRAMAEVDLAMKNSQTLANKLNEENQAAAASAEALTKEAGSTAKTNFNDHRVDKPAEQAVSQINAATNRAMQENYDNVVRNAKRLESVKQSYAKQDLTAGIINAKEYQAQATAALEEYARVAIEQEEILFANLKGTQKTGNEELDRINLAAKKKKIQDELATNKQLLQDQIDYNVRASEIAADAFTAKQAARLSELNSAAALNRAKAQKVFDHRFDTKADTEGAKASAEAQKPYDKEIAAAQKLLEISEKMASIDAGADTDNPRIIALRKEIDLLTEAKDAAGELADAQAASNQKISESWESGASKAIKDFIDNTENAAKQSERLFTKAFRGMEDELVKFVRTGKLDFSSLANSIVEDLIRIQIRESMTKVFSGLGGGEGIIGMIKGVLGGGSDSSSVIYDLLPDTSSQYWSASANGNVFSNGTMQAFANGGAFTNKIVNSPTSFPMGLMGEAGPEAIMPLSRDSSGRLGVSGGGGSNTSVQVIVNNNGSKTKAETSETVDSRGNRRVEVTISDMVAGEVGRAGSAMSNSLRTSFSAQPTLVRR